MAEKLFVDTNVFLRFLTRDDPRKAEQARKLFQDAVDGRVTLVISLMVVAEIVWTLESFYKLSKQDVAAKVETILNTPNLECPEGELALYALDLYTTKNVDFIDAYHVFLLKSQGLSRIVTYDRKHFKRMPDLEIVEPGPIDP